jgi:hypothetical protein
MSIFEYIPDPWDLEEDEREPRNVPRCRSCGSTDVRWRQQTGKWVLFSLQPGVEHSCPGVTDDSGFDVVSE